MNVYVETYGCRMNICDSEVIINILKKHGYHFTAYIENADVVVLNCCSVREIGHQVIYRRVTELDSLLQCDVILCIAGCMATQLNEDSFNHISHPYIIATPSSYRDLPVALESIKNRNKKQILIVGSNKTETYDDILPIRVLEDGIMATVTIMKGCDIYCSYCIEPYTRGQRTNRSYESIMAEIEDVCNNGYREITLFGHIVDLWEGRKNGNTINFADLLEDIAKKYPNQRIKYISSHPLTFSDAIIRIVKTYDNIMRVVHLPVQSGSDAILQRMNRRYTNIQFLQRVERIREQLPDIQIITDVMVGFPGETEQDFQMTLEILRQLKCANANVYTFSMRRGTIAYHKYQDDVPESTKEKRKKIVERLIDKIRLEQLQKLIGSMQVVLVEKANEDCWSGRDFYHRNVLFRSIMPIQIGRCYNILIRGIKDNQLFGEIR